MDFLELARGRRSVRGFSADPVHDEQVTTLLEAARAAPSGGNCQPWHFYVIRDPEIRAELAGQVCRQSFVGEAPVLIAVCTETERNQRYGERGRLLYCLQDTAAAVQNILLCAHSLGLGTCWIGAFDEAAAIRVLGIPEGRRPIALIPVGVPAQPANPRPRRPLEEIVTYR